ncbi:MAG: hypothetical protein CM1200mP2_13310 [Planctomycetaceae bacterium]|nr:MAG: hypothetical protein CM1200mP2_13310 [Planctomycetaceae bacterium]
MSVFVVRMFTALLLTTLVFVAEVSAELRGSVEPEAPGAEQFCVQLLDVKDLQ